MKLSRVNLARVMPIGRSTKADLTESDGELSADMGSRTIRVGGQIIPFEAVNIMTPAEPEMACPECKKRFVNGQALGAHRIKAHGVKGGGGETA